MRIKISVSSGAFSTTGGFIGDSFTLEVPEVKEYDEVAFKTPPRYSSSKGGLYNLKENLSPH